MKITFLAAVASFLVISPGRLVSPPPATAQTPNRAQTTQSKSGVAPPVRNTSYELAGERVLRQEGIVGASLREVWTTCTTANGMRTYLAPVVDFELRTGGKYETNYQPGSKIGDPGTIHNEVLAYLPQRMLAFKIGLTDNFPEGPRQSGTLFAVLEFEKISDRKTKVIISIAGLGTGPEWDQVYKFFETGNAYMLAELRKRFVNGPVKWK
jgi:hypothetical protein